MLTAIGEVLLFIINWLFCAITDHRFNKQSSTNQCSSNVPSFIIQRDHLSGKHGNVRELDSCQENVRDFTKIGEMSGKKSCLGKVA